MFSLGYSPTCVIGQSVRVGSHSSPNPCLVGVPQGSVLGPLLFSIYTSPISTIAKSHQVSQQQYADDTQLYVALLPANYNQDITALESCLNSLRNWFCENGMALNPTKSVAILFGTSQKLKSFSSLTIPVMSLGQTFNSDKLKILGATLDSNLTMESHIKALSSSCFYHIRSFKQIPSSLDYDMAISVASALVSSRLDHVNSIPYGAASKHTNRLQRVQKALTRTVMHQRSHGSPVSSTALLQNLHWLPIEWRIRFKLATLAYNQSINQSKHISIAPYVASITYWPATLPC